VQADVDEPALRPQHARNLPQRKVVSVDVRVDERSDHRVERFRVEWQLARVRLDEILRELGDPGTSNTELIRGQVDPDDPPGLTRERRHEDAGAAAEVEAPPGPEPRRSTINRSAVCAHPDPSARAKTPYQSAIAS
jgi:hypothetical protein